MKLSSLYEYDPVRRHPTTLWELRGRIQNGKVHPTYQEFTPYPGEEEQIIVNALQSRQGLTLRIGAKENVDGTWNIHLPYHFQVLIGFLRDVLTLRGKTLYQYEDPGIFESIQVDVFVFRPTSKQDHTRIH